MPLYNYRKRRLEIKIEPGDKPSVGYEINYKEKWSVSRPPTGPREVRECWTEESARPAASVRELKKSRTTQPSLSVEDVENESGDSPCRVQQSPAEQVRAVRLDRFATLAVVEGIDGTRLPSRLMASPRELPSASANAVAMRERTRSRLHRLDTTSSEALGPPKEDDAATPHSVFGRTPIQPDLLNSDWQTQSLALFQQIATPAAAVAQCRRRK